MHTLRVGLFTRFLVFLGLLSCTFNLWASPLDNWHWRNPLPNGNLPSGPFSLYGIVFTNATFFSVGQFGLIFTSSNGTNWEQGTTASTNQLNDIIYAGGQFVAVGNAGTIETSSDGTNWVLQNSGTLNPLTAVSYGASGIYVAVGPNAIISSRNGVSWSSATSGPGWRHWNCRFWPGICGCK